MVSKVLQISSYPPPRAGWGVRVQHIKRYIEENGHVCKVLNIGKSRLIESEEYLICRNGFDFLFKTASYSMRRYTIHMHMNGDSPKGFVLSIMALTVNRLLGRKPFLTFHAGPIQKYFQLNIPIHLALMYRYIFSLPEFIICNSDHVKRRIVDLGIRGDKIHAIPAFSKQYLDFKAASLPQELEEFMARRNPVVCSYVFFRPEFFIESLIDAIALASKDHPDIGLIILGCDDGSDAIRSKINKEGLAENVYFTGDLDHDLFLTILKKTAMYIRTPSKDGVCSSVLESLSLGVPVIASHNGTRPESVITFLADNATDLCEKILFALDNYDEIKTKVVKPFISDTVAIEGNLIINNAGE